MNWTAILALLAGNVLSAYVTLTAINRFNDSRAAAVFANERAHKAEMRSVALLQELEESQTLHRNLLARRSANPRYVEGLEARIQGVMEIADAVAKEIEHERPGKFGAIEPHVDALMKWHSGGDEFSIAHQSSRATSRKVQHQERGNAAD